jgi:hypothetical protein
MTGDDDQPPREEWLPHLTPAHEARLLVIAAAIHHGEGISAVVLDLGVAWIALTADEARSVADSLLATADQVDAQRN